MSAAPLSISPLSSGLQDLLNDFVSVQDDADGISMDQEQVIVLVKVLTALQALATNLEIEVRCHRDNEAGRGARTFLEEEATGHLADILPEVEGNVVRPAFGKGERS
ncbi:hypothetical protein PDO_1915 [Rhizobium sp. PDO1-076]|uniref:hypothetical protein n=1 Tax=Rhizobium sp. PDO1-076 TaxID=1125979 RepID=UPI00024E35DC|nr:hypothetical protein [Rhizobium sp. PDO1-076]EHS51524.1 hypothetical protein PDO_1915 [Rhizobium sp. PDO1-076]